MLTTTEAAKELGVTAQSIRNYVKSQELKAITVYIGKKPELRLKMSDLIEFKRGFMHLPYSREIECRIEKKVGDTYFISKKEVKIVKIINESFENDLFTYKLNVIDV